MKIGEFKLTNGEKLNRAMEGRIGKNGLLYGGMAEKISKGEYKPIDQQDKKEREVFDNALLAEYDRLGGLIMKGELKVKTGSFWDFVKKCPLEKPNVSFVTSLDGELLDVSEEEAEAIEISKKKVKEIKEKKLRKK